MTDVWKYQKNHWADYETAKNCNPNDPMLREIASYAKQVAHAVGIHYGAAHVELKAQRKEDTLHYEEEKGGMSSVVDQYLESFDW